jgi:hypothetical protein
MKPVEEAFASTGFRRVILPGIVLTAGFHPLLSNAMPAIVTAYAVSALVLIVAEVLFFGLVVSSGLQWVYYLYEGFRFPLITRLARRGNELRLARYKTKRQALYSGRTFDQLSVSEQDQVTRLYEYLCDFPLRQHADGSVEHYVERPTRLGNVIATYELYPMSRYGVDGVYYWRHLLNLAPDSSRKEFEDQYAFAENLVLTSFGGAVVALMHVSVLLGWLLGKWAEPLVSLPIGPITSAWLVLFGIGVWYLFYRAALPAHREAAAAFRSIVDAVMTKFVEWVRATDAPLQESDRQRIDQLTEYLKALDRCGTA